jgi:parvulin-like peptidyl-prolyl isomerase
MKKQMKLIFPAVFAVTLFALPRAQAAAANAAATNASASTATNAKPADAMTALFSDPVIAKGNGFEIKRSELDEVMTGIKSTAAARGQTITPGQLTRIEGQLLKQLIDIQLLLQKATDADKAIGKEQFEKSLRELKTRQKLTDAEFDQKLSQQLQLQNMTREQWYKQNIDQATVVAVLTRELNVIVTDAEVKQFYDDTNHLANFEQPEMVHVRHILLMTMDPVTHTPLAADQQKAKQKQMDDLLKRIRGGADFAALAKQYSEDPSSKDNGGEVPAFPRGQMGLPEFDAAAFSLTNNQVSDVITSPVGYHIIKLLDKTPAKKLALTDKVPLSDVTIASTVKDFLTQQKIGKLAPAYLEKLQKAADVQILDAGLKAAAATAAAAANAPVATPEN